MKCEFEIQKAKPNTILVMNEKNVVECVYELETPQAPQRLFSNLTTKDISLLTQINGTIKVNTINDDLIAPTTQFKFDIKYWREN